MDQHAPDPTTTPQTPTRRPTLTTADLDRFDALSAKLGHAGTAAERFGALLDWAQQQLTTPATPEPAVIPALTDQAKALAWLTDEISTLRQQLATAQQTAAQAQNWTAERSRMQAKIDSLTEENRTLHKRLDRFDQMRQALLAGELPTEETMRATTAAPDAPQTAPAAPGATEAPEAAPRRTQPAQERAARIWQAVQTWNDTPDRPHSEKVAISATTLERQFGLFRPAAQRFIADHLDEITDHAQAHGITAPTHNRGVPAAVWDVIKANLG